MAEGLHSQLQATRAAAETKEAVEEGDAQMMPSDMIAMRNEKEAALQEQQSSHEQAAARAREQFDRENALLARAKADSERRLRTELEDLKAAAAEAHSAAEAAARLAKSRHDSQLAHLGSALKTRLVQLEARAKAAEAQAGAGAGSSVSQDKPEGLADLRAAHEARSKALSAEVQALRTELARTAKVHEEESRILRHRIDDVLQEHEADVAREVARATGALESQLAAADSRARDLENQLKEWESTRLDREMRMQGETLRVRIAELEGLLSERQSEM